MIIRSEDQSGEVGEGSKLSYRVKRGTRYEDVPVPSTSTLPALSSFNGPFQVAEYLAMKVKADPHDIDGLVDVPGMKGKNVDIDKSLWIYEHLRRIPIDLTALVTSLLPICTRESCPEMKADEWMYLCVAHEGKTEECCAIDYILHTLDSTTALLNSTKQFPSRLSIPNASLTYFPSLFRRLSRIFSHAYYHHRETFALCEVETALYARFVGLCVKYDLVTPTLLYVPKEAAKMHAGVDAEEEDSGRGHEHDAEEHDVDEEEDEDEDDDEDEDELEEDDSRGRDKDNADNGNKRTRSLDRDRPEKNVDIPTRQAPRDPTPADSSSTSQTAPSASDSAPQSDPASTPLSSEPTRSDTMVNLSSVAPDSPARSHPPVQTKGGAVDVDDIEPVDLPDSRTLSRGTNGRGKQPRGTMLWTSDSTPPPVPQLPADAAAMVGGGADLSKTESRETAIRVGSSESSDVADGDTAPDVSETEISKQEDEVPKDEIDLLEEAGALDQKPEVSPLPTSTQPATAAPVEPIEAITNDEESRDVQPTDEAASHDTAISSESIVNGDTNGTASAASPDISTSPDFEQSAVAVSPAAETDVKLGAGAEPIQDEDDGAEEEMPSPDPSAGPETGTITASSRGNGRRRRHRGKKQQQQQQHA